LTDQFAISTLHHPRLNDHDRCKFRAWEAADDWGEEVRTSMGEMGLELAGVLPYVANACTDSQYVIASPLKGIGANSQWSRVLII
jgi:hypothetical protein